MEYVYAAMMLHKAGKSISEDAITAVLKAAGIEVNAARVKATVTALKGVKIDEVIKNAPSAQPALEKSAGGEKPKGGAPAEEKKAEPAEDTKKKEEEAAAGLSALFG